MPKWSYTFLQEVCSVVVINAIAILGFFSKLTYIHLLLILLTSISIKNNSATYFDFLLFKEYLKLS